MNPGSSKVIAGCFGLSAFAVAVLAGLAAEISTAQILSRSLVAMIACYPVGLIVGAICQRVIQTHVRAHEAANPAASADNPAPEIASPPSQNEEVIVV